MDDYSFNETVAVARAATIDTLQKAVATNEGRLKVVKDMGPDFEQFYMSESYQRAMAEHPKLAEAILQAENDISFQQSHLPDFYSTIWDVAIGKGAQPQAQPTARIQRQPQEPHVSLSSSRDRQRLISDFEERYGTDVNIDLADNSQGRF